MKKMLIVLMMTCIFLAGCGITVSKTDESAESGPIEKSENAIEPLTIKELTDNWPESICSQADGVWANPLCTEMVIDEPMTLSILAETMEGSLRMKIVNTDTLEVCFDEKNPDGAYSVSIDKMGIYQIRFYAKEHVGSVEIAPE